MTALDMVAFDLETDGVDVETAHLITACVGRVVGGVATTTTWLACPAHNFVMPDGATAVNGLTTERIRADGAPIARVVAQVAEELEDAILAGLPIVGHNLAFDITTLDRNCRRHGITPIVERVGSMLCIDTMVIDRHLKPYRRRVSAAQGPYQLKTTCQVWGVSWSDDAAHDAEYDAMQAARVAWKMLHSAELGGVDLENLHDAQTGWAAEQAASFAGYLRRCGEHDRAAAVDGTWPIRPIRTAQKGHQQ